MILDNNEQQPYDGFGGSDLPYDGADRNDDDHRTNTDNYEDYQKHTEYKVGNPEQSANVVEATTSSFEQNLTQNQVGQGWKDVKFAANVIFSGAIDRATSYCLTQENQKHMDADYKNLNAIMNENINRGLSPSSIATNEEVFRIIENSAKDMGFEGGIRIGSAGNRLTNLFNNDANVMNLNTEHDITIKAYDYAGVDPKINKHMQVLDASSMKINEPNSYGAKTVGEYLQKHQQATVNLNQNAISNSRNVQQTLREDAVFKSLGCSNIKSERDLKHTVQNRDFVENCRKANINCEKFVVFKGLDKDGKPIEQIDFDALKKAVADGKEVDKHLAALAEISENDVFNQGARGSHSRQSERRHSRTQRLIANKMKQNASATTAGIYGMHNMYKMAKESYSFWASVTDYGRHKSITNASKRLDKLEKQRLKDNMSERAQRRNARKTSKYTHKKNARTQRQQELDDRRKERYNRSRQAKKERRQSNRADKRKKFSERTRTLGSRAVHWIGNRRLPGGRHLRDTYLGRGAKFVGGKLNAVHAFREKINDAIKERVTKLLAKLAAPLQWGKIAKIVVLAILLALYLIPSAMESASMSVLQTFNCFNSSGEDDDKSVGEKAIEALKDKTIDMRDKGMAQAKTLMRFTPNGFYTDAYGTKQACVGTEGISIIPIYYNQLGSQIPETEFYLTRETIQAIQCQSNMDSNYKTFVKQAKAIFDATHEYTGCAQSGDIRFDNYKNQQEMDSCTNQQILYHTPAETTEAMNAYLDNNSVYLLQNYENNHTCKAAGAQEHGGGYTVMVRYADGHLEEWDKHKDEGGTCKETGHLVKTTPCGITAKGNICKASNPNKVEDATLEYYACNHGVCQGHVMCGGHMSCTASFKANTVIYTNKDDRIMDVENSKAFFDNAYNAIKKYYVVRVKPNPNGNNGYLTGGSSTSNKQEITDEDTLVDEDKPNRLDMTDEDNLSTWFDLLDIDWEEVYGIKFFDTSTGLVSGVKTPLTEDQLAQVQEQAPSEAALQVVNYANAQIGAMYLYGSSHGGVVETFSIDLYNHYAQEYPAYIGSLDAYQKGGFDINATNIICYDCSSLVMWSMNSAIAQGGQACPYSSSKAWMASTNFQEVDKSELLPGDICAKSGHVGIYAGIIDGVPCTIEALDNADGVCVVTNGQNQFTKFFRPNPGSGS